MEIKRYGKKRLLLLSLFFIFVVVEVVFLVYGLSKANSATFIIITDRIDIDDNLVIRDFPESNPYAEAGLEIGDTITQIDEVDVGNYSQFIEIYKIKKMGDKISVTVKRGNQERILSAAVPRSIKGYLYVISASIYAFFWSLVGLLVFLKIPKDEISKIFYLSTLAFGVIPVLPLLGVEVLDWFLQEVWVLSAPFAFGLFLHFTLIYPEKKEILKRREYLLYFIYAIASVSSIGGGIDSTFWLFTKKYIFGSFSFGTIYFPTLMVFGILAAVSLFLSYKGTREPNDKRKIRLVVWATIIAITLSIIFRLARTINLPDILTSPLARPSLLLSHRY